MAHVSWAPIVCAALLLPALIAALQTRSVLLDVHVRITDLDNRPIAGAPARVVMGSASDWQQPERGRRFATGADGTYAFETSAALDTQSRKLPTNFVDSLLSRPQPVDHLRVAAELPYATFSWLYVVDICRFRSGDPVMLDAFAVYSRDASGAFTVRATQRTDGWEIRDLGRLRLTTPGYEVSDFQLQPVPDTTGARWTLSLAFKRHPAPVVR